MGIYDELMAEIVSVEETNFDEPLVGAHTKVEGVFRGNSPTGSQRRQSMADVLVTYGGKCSCCGETDWNVLDIDHVNGGGKEHRESAKIVARLKEYLAEYKSGKYQLLCANCHRRKTAKELGYDKNRLKGLGQFPKC